jgi:hypothetical protein
VGRALPALGSALKSFGRLSGGAQAIAENGLTVFLQGGAAGQALAQGLAAAPAAAGAGALAGYGAPDVASGIDPLLQSFAKAPEEGNAGGAPGGEVNPGDLKVLSKSRIKQLGFDAEAFKADIVGQKGGAKFNIAVGPTGEIYLVPVRPGATPPVPTGHTIHELPNMMYPLGGE